MSPITITALVFVALGIVAVAEPTLFGEGFFSLANGTSYAYGIKDAFGKIDWNVIMMIAGTMGTVYLFIESKMPQLMSDVLLSKMPNVKWTVVALSLFAGIVSAFVDNVATVLMIVPVIASGLNMEPMLLYYGLLCGATLGGNLTPIGASANIAGLGILRKEGYEVKGTTFMKYGVPFTLAAVITGYILLLIIWR